MRSAGGGRPGGGRGNGLTTEGTEGTENDRRAAVAEGGVTAEAVVEYLLRVGEAAYHNALGRRVRLGERSREHTDREVLWGTCDACWGRDKATLGAAIDLVQRYGAGIDGPTTERTEGTERGGGGAVLPGIE